MVFELTILSIFRQSAHYLPRYFSQIERVFELCGKKCHAVWLEGDSEDATYAMLHSQKQKLEALGHEVTLIKFEVNAPYWPSVKESKRWFQLATCWNRCLDHLLPTRYAVCVESDLIWEPDILLTTISHLNAQRQVICPMLMTEGSQKLFGMDQFYDSWGFSRNGKKFSTFEPYWEFDSELLEDCQFLQVSTGGGMIVSTYEAMSNARWGLDCCILQFPKDVGIFMDKTLQIYHPIPERWKNLSLLNRILRKYKYRAIIFLKSLRKGEMR